MKLNVDKGFCVLAPEAPLPRVSHFGTYAAVLKKAFVGRVFSVRSDVLFWDRTAHNANGWALNHHMVAMRIQVGYDE
jgi:hypothetical protein